MKLFSFLVCSLFLCCYSILLLGQTKHIPDDFSTIQKAENGNYFIIKKNTSEPPRTGWYNPKRFADELRAHKTMDEQREQSRLLYDTQEQAKKEHEQKQIVREPEIKKIKINGRETHYLEGPHLSVPVHSLVLNQPSTANVLINGKQADTIVVGSPFTVSFAFAPNSISALVSIYVDMNHNGSIDNGDVKLLSNGLVYDNGEYDLNPAEGQYKEDYTINNMYSAILSSLIFEVNNFQSVSTATLTMIENNKGKIITGIVTPVFKNTTVHLTGYPLSGWWEKFIFPDSTGTFVARIDTSNTEIYYELSDFGDTTPYGYTPPFGEYVQIEKETTHVAILYKASKEFIEGYVKDQDGNPVQNANISIETYCYWHCWRVYLRALSDSLGYYKVGVYEGDWSVYCNSPSTSDEYMQNPYYSYYYYYYISVGRNKTVRNDFMFIKSNATITGTIKYGATGVGGMYINVQNDSLYNSTSSTGNGNYSLKVFKPSSGTLKYSVNANTDFYSGYYVDSSSRPNVPAGSTNINFTVKKVTGGVEGRITDAKTGLPVKNAYGYFSGNGGRSIVADDSGYYKVRLMDGTYSFNVSASLYEEYYESNIVISGSVLTKNIFLNKTGTFSGTVKDGSGNPVYNATVYSFRVMNSQTGMSDMQGKYTVGGLETGSYTARAKANGFVEQWYNNKSRMDSNDVFQVIKGFDTPNINFTLSRGGSISGVVKDKAGKRISNAYIHVLDFVYPNYFISTTKTDDSGKYVATGLSTGKYFVEIYHNDYLYQIYNGVFNIANATPVSVTINQNTPNINFIVSPGGTIMGKVVDKAGNPISNAQVTATDSLFTTMFYGYSNDSGMYKIARIDPRGKMYVTAVASGYAQRWYNNAASTQNATPIILQPDELRNSINFTLPEAGKISGTVKNKAGSPIQYASVYAHRTSGFADFYANTDQFGEYTLDNLPAGKYFVSVDHYNYMEQYYNLKQRWELADTVIVEEENTTSNINFILKQGGKISGIVKAKGGDPVPNASVIARDILNNNTYYYSSDRNGEYTVQNLPTGKYYISAYSSEHIEQWWDHKTSMLLAETIQVQEEQTTPNINFDLKSVFTDSVVIKIVVDNLPDSLTFSKSSVPDYAIDYHWGIRFDVTHDTLVKNPFETEIALFHAKNPGDSEFRSDIISATRHVTLQWFDTYANNLHSNVRVWRDPKDKNVLYLAAPKLWWEMQYISNATKFYGRTMCYGANSQITDSTTIGTGEMTVFDAKGDLVYAYADIISAGWKTETPTAVNVIIDPPKYYSLSQNFPNPFNPTTVISYQLPVISKVKLKIYDVLGREVATLVNEEQSAGWKEVEWNASAMSSGIYFYKITAGSFVDVKKMLVVK